MAATQERPATTLLESGSRSPRHQSSQRRCCASRCADAPSIKADDLDLTDVDLEAVDAKVSSVKSVSAPLQVAARRATVEHRQPISTVHAAENLSCSDAKPVSDDEAPPKAEQSPASAESPRVDTQTHYHAELVEEGPRKYVRMDSAPPIVHEITPYAELYGMHPREFVFDKLYHMVPAIGFADVATACEYWQEAADEEGSDSDGEDAICTDGWDLEYSI